jgi:hypothetical protein
MVLRYVIACTVHIVKSCLIYGIILGCPRYASWAGKAQNLLSNPDNMVKHITRSYDGDGLVARAYQYYPKPFYNPVTKTTKTLLYNVYEPPGKKGYGYAEVYMPTIRSRMILAIRKCILKNIVIWAKRIKP